MVQGVGTVEWVVRDDEGQRRTLRTRCFYVPASHVRLFSPQRYFQECHGGKFEVNHVGSIFRFSGGGKMMFAPWDAVNGIDLPMAYLIRDKSSLQQRESMTATCAYNVVAESNNNLSEPQKELLRWHFKLGHFNLAWIQRLMRVRDGEEEPVIQTRLKATTNCQ
jgi:hypothetical protein